MAVFKREILEPLAPAPSPTRNLPEGAGAAVIWTTTPWTLPGNQGLAAHPSHAYELVDTDKGALLLAGIG